MRKRLPGEGSIYRRKSDGRWVAALSEGPRGARVYRQRYAPARNNTKAAARRLLEEMVSSLDPSTETVGAYLERWANDARGIRDTTKRGYLAVVRTWLGPMIGHIRLSELTPVHVNDVLRTIEAQRSPKTARNVHATLRRALGQAVRTGLVSRNVASREFVDTPRVPVEEPRALSEAEVERLLAVASKDRLSALFVVAVDTGLRQGELLGLAWQDIGDVLHVRHELTYTPGAKRGKGRYQRGELKTQRSRRDVPLTERAKRALEAHRQAMIEEGFVPVATGPVFVARAGQPISGSWLTHHFYDLLAEAKITRLPFKNLRTTFASRLYAAGVPETTVAQLLGHARTNTTKRHYIATTAGQAEDAIRRLA